MKLVVLALAIFLSACATGIKVSESARKVQIVKESNTLVGSCKKIGPISATVNKIMPAQTVYDEAVWKARDNVARKGGDTMVLLNDDHTTNGLANIITVQAIALKCY